MRSSTPLVLIVAVVGAGCSFNPGPPHGGGGAGGGVAGFGGSTIVYPGGGSGGATGTDGGTSPDAGCGSNLTGVLRDFLQAHPDFEEFTFIGDDRAIVTDALGADGKPVYAGSPVTPTTTGKAAFDQWYRDVAGVNQSLGVTLPFVPGPGGIMTYDNSNFFPIDGRLWGNEGHEHNYHFTFELHTQFTYQGGETFRFRGDDDVFTYINGHLVVNLGGIHEPEEALVNLDQEAARLGITPGNIYDLDFFFAERHLVLSNFRIDTSIVFVDCGHIVE